MRIPFYYISYNINDLHMEEYESTSPIAKLRQSTKILIIDDDDFPLFHPLQSSGYNLSKRNGNDDIKNLDDVIVYDIILCDIKGVGKNFGGNFEGAHLAKELKIKYPDKIIISYTASTHEIQYQKLLSKLDGVYPKGIGVEDWTTILDEKIKEIYNPIACWEKTRTILFEHKISTIDVAKLEHYYVKSIKTKNSSIIEKQITGDKVLYSILSDILQSLILKVIKNLL